jgi:aspartyl-tRNA(Asn)/glutamyl-tRNA(Gln) amidotransferase subunit B
MRCEANVSLRPEGSSKFGVLNEIKNIGSLRGVERAVKYEVERQRDILQQGGEVVRQTRRWNEQAQKNEAMRSKEEAHDYRYFPDPDLVKLTITDEWIERVRKELPELPGPKRKRLMEHYNLPAYDAGELVSDRSLSSYFEETVSAGANAKSAANWLLTDVRACLNAHDTTIDEILLTPSALAELIALLEKGDINRRAAKEVLSAILPTGESPRCYVERHGLLQLSDRESIAAFVKQAIEENPQAVEDYRKGKERALKALVGSVMRLSRGKANPEMANDLLKELL